MIRREELARVLSRSVTGADPDQIVVWPNSFEQRGSFTLAPKSSSPLWTYFLDAADEAIKLFEASL